MKPRPRDRPGSRPRPHRPNAHPRPRSTAAARWRPARAASGAVAPAHARGPPHPSPTAPRPLRAMAARPSRSAAATASRWRQPARRHGTRDRGLSFFRGSVDRQSEESCRQCRRRPFAGVLAKIEYVDHVHRDARGSRVCRRVPQAGTTCRSRVRPVRRPRGRDVRSRPGRGTSPASRVPGDDRREVRRLANRALRGRRRSSVRPNCPDRRRDGSSSNRSLTCSATSADTTTVPAGIERASACACGSGLPANGNRHSGPAGSTRPRAIPAASGGLALPAGDDATSSSAARAPLHCQSARRARTPRRPRRGRSRPQGPRTVPPCR